MHNGFTCKDNLWSAIKNCQMESLRLLFSCRYAIVKKKKNVRFGVEIAISAKKIQFSCFLKKLIYFNWRIITLQYCNGFCHTLTWISHGCACVPHPEHPSHFSPQPIPQNHPSAPALSTLSHAFNLGWQSVSHMIIYMFQCYSLKSSHPFLLPQSKILFCTPVSLAVLHIGSSLPSS